MNIAMAFVGRQSAIDQYANDELNLILTLPSYPRARHILSNGQGFALKRTYSRTGTLRRREGSTNISMSSYRRRRDWRSITQANLHKNAFGYVVMHSWCRRLTERKGVR